MEESNKPVLHTEKVEPFEKKDDAPATEQPKKSKLKFHLILMLILGVGTWAFVTYAPIVKKWKAQWYDFTHQPITNEEPYHAEPVQPSFAPRHQPASQAPDTVNEPIEEPIAENTPILEPTPELAAPEPVEAINAESLADLSALVTQLQNQLVTMQENMNQMYAQQAEQSKQQVRAQLFADLQLAATEHNVQRAAATWKSISLLPYLDENRRAQAEQAWQDLEGLSQDIETLNQDIIDNLLALADKLRPEELADVAETMDNLVDAYANADTFSTWLDWLKDQFKISKVDRHAIHISDDPYANIKALMNQLDKLKNALSQGQWQTMPDLDNLVHQLEQLGLETSISPEVIQQIQATQQQWQEEAKSWMEQL
jgi:hypothetical protein